MIFLMWATPFSSGSASLVAAVNCRAVLFVAKRTIQVTVRPHFSSYRPFPNCRMNTRQVFPRFVFLSLVTGMWSGAQTIQSDAGARVSGRYNTDATTPVFVSQPDDPPPVAGTAATAEASAAEGGVYGAARGEVMGRRLLVSGVAQPTPHAGFGSTAVATAEAGFFDGWQFFAIAHDVRGARMVVCI